jgi:hypothetical protein
MTQVGMSMWQHSLVLHLLQEHLYLSGTVAEL